MKRAIVKEEILAWKTVMNSFKIIILCILLSSITVQAHSEEIKTYRNNQFGYSISYPSKWEQKNSDNVNGANFFSVANNTDMVFTVTARLLTGSYKGRHRSISDVPNVVEDSIVSLRYSNKSTNIQSSGKTTLSNTDAVWITSSFIYQDMWVANYQVLALQNDKLYTITAKTYSSTQEGANNLLRKNWTFLSGLISSIKFYK